VLQRISVAWLTKLMRRPSFWLLVAVFALITIPHYGEELKHPAFLVDLMADLGVERHAFERIAYLAPIVWAGFLFGQRGAIVTSLVALACMLPRAIIISLYPKDALFEAIAVFIVGNLVSFSFESLRKERERRIQLAALNQTSSVVSESLELSQVLKGSVDNAMDVMGVDAALVFLLDEETGELTLAAHQGVSEGFVQGVGSLKLGEGFNGRVAQTGEPLFVEDASEDPGLTRMVVREERIRSQIIVPLKSKGKVMGTLCAAMRSDRQFRQDEVDLLTAIGNQVGVAVENARLYEKEHLAIQRLAASERNYRGLFENASDAIWVHDLEGNFVVANIVAEQITGYSLEELLGMNVKSLLRDEGRALARQIRRKLFENEPLEQPYEQRIIKKDGAEAILKLTTSLVMEDGVPTGFQNIARDVTVEKRMQDNLRYYLSQIGKAQEEERKRISRELHDETIQALVVLSRQLDALASSPKGMSKGNSLLLEELRQQTNDIMEGVRRLSQDLRPPTLDRLGLVPALEWLASDVAEYSGIATKINVLGTERRLPEEVELVLFRISQEALRNVWRHSQATSAEVTVEFNEDKTRLTVSDNGKGFDPPSSVGDLARDGKLGLAGMEERAQLLGGSMTLKSEPGKGTTVTTEVPI